MICALADKPKKKKTDKKSKLPHCRKHTDRGGESLKSQSKMHNITLGYYSVIYKTQEVNKFSSCTETDVSAEIHFYSLKQIIQILFFVEMKL